MMPYGTELTQDELEKLAHRIAGETASMFTHEACITTAIAVQKEIFRPRQYFDVDHELAPVICVSTKK
jgi:hypothetical protein